MADDRNDRIDPKHELPWPEESDPRSVGEQFADPNSADDRRLGKEFRGDATRARKKHTPPLKEQDSLAGESEAAVLVSDCVCDFGGRGAVGWWAAAAVPR